MSKIVGLSFAFVILSSTMLVIGQEMEKKTAEKPVFVPAEVPT